MALVYIKPRKINLTQNVIDGPHCMWHFMYHEIEWISNWQSILDFSTDIRTKWIDTVNYVENGKYLFQTPR